MKEGDTNEATPGSERRFFADEPALDPYDLSTLKPQRKPLRIILALAVLVACSYLLYDSRGELAFFFQGSTPTALGSIDDEAVKARFYDRKMPSNDFVSFTGLPNYPPFLWGTVGGLGRGPASSEHARLVVFPPKEGTPEGAQPGSINHVGSVVRLSYTPVAVIYYAANSTPREHLKGNYEGRLVQVKDAPFLGPIQRFLWTNYALALPEDAYVMLDGERPSSAWVYALFGLLAVLAILYNLLVLRQQIFGKKPTQASGRGLASESTPG
jgi:hypothetical protein